MKITFFIDATIMQDEKGFVTTCCLLDDSMGCTTFTKKNIMEYYEEGKLLLSSVPFDAIVTFDSNLITFGEAVTTSIEQILIESSINNLKRKLKVIDENIDTEDLSYEIVYFETIARYVEVLEDSINGNENIKIDIKMVNCQDIKVEQCPGYQISSIQNDKYLEKYYEQDEEEGK